MEMALTRHEARRALKKRSAGALPPVTNASQVFSRDLLIHEPS
jgi:hypothetical protein